MTRGSRPAATPPGEYLEFASELFGHDLDVLSMLPWPTREPSPVHFGSPVWDLSAVTTWPAYAPRAALTWEGIANPRWRTTAKEVALLLMCPQIGIDRHLPRVRRRPYPPWALPYQRMSYWRRWFAFLAAHGHTSLRTVTQSVSDGFLSTITPESRHIAISALRVFADYEPLLTYGGYADGFRPWGTLSAAAASGQPRLGEAGNKTPPIPDRVLAPLLAACLHIVDHVGPDVRSAQQELARLRAIEAPRGGVPTDFDAKLDEYLAELLMQGRPVPCVPSGAINASMVALHIGMRDATALNRADRWSKITEAAEVVGTGVGGLRGARPGVEFDLRGLTTTSLVVRTACFIVVAALSGMRHSELAAIGPDAVRREELSSGLVRHRVASRLLKGEKPGGRREVWTVIEPVVRALSLAQELNPGPYPLRCSGFADQYKRLWAWVNAQAANEGLKNIPSDWHLEPRQFRRTLSRELAWRPGGIIAGKIHLKHISVATTEGYAGKRGESAAAFIAEIEAERRAHNLRATEQVLRAVQNGEPVAGLGARALAVAVAETGDPPATAGAQVRDRDAALAALVRTRADTLHAMPLAFCWFMKPDQARCLRDVKDKSKPLVGACSPDKCPNATIHQRHAPAWLSGLDALRSTIADRRIPHGERARLSAKADEIEAVVRALQRSGG